MPAGRPTLYRPAYCEAVKDFHTLTGFARHIGVVFQTVYQWTYKHPEFAEAVKAMTRSLPTLYRPEYCDDVVDCLKDGHSLAAFAAKVDVAPKSIYDWMARHPEFADAVTRAQAKSVLWWERRLLDLAQNGQGNAKVVIFGLKNRAPEHWRDSNHTQMSGTVERVHRIERVIVRPGEAQGGVS
jgi:hypothetical protein